MRGKNLAALGQLLDPLGVDSLLLGLLPFLEGLLDHIILKFLVYYLLLQCFDHPVLLLKLFLLRGQLVLIACLLHPLFWFLDGMHELVDADSLALYVRGLVDLGLCVTGLYDFLEFVGALKWFSTH